MSRNMIEKHMIKSLSLSSLLLTALVTGCAHIEQPSERALKPSTDWVLNSPEWGAEAEAVFSDAASYLARVERSKPDGSWGVILDLDETVINNVDYQRVRDVSGTSYSPETWFDWTQQEAATLVPGASSFIKFVNESGGHIAFVTNRRDTEQLATERNLENLGLLRHFDFRVLLTRAGPNGQREKDDRFKLVSNMLATQGYPGVEIIAYIGDNKGDKPAIEGDWKFFCINQGGMYGDYCAAPPIAGR